MSGAKTPPVNLPTAVFVCKLSPCGHLALDLEPQSSRLCVGRGGSAGDSGHAGYESQVVRPLLFEGTVNYRYRVTSCDLPLCLGDQSSFCAVFQHIIPLVFSSLHLWCIPVRLLLHSTVTWVRNSMRPRCMCCCKPSSLQRTLNPRRTPICPPR